MRGRLVGEGVISEKFATGRGFHYSKSPFEQLLDARGYLLGTDGTPVPLQETSFGKYLLDHGIPFTVIQGILDHPVGWFLDGDGSTVEDSIFSATYQMSFSDALEVLTTMTAQYDFGA
jgi:hypothetical protein